MKKILILTLVMIHMTVFAQTKLYANKKESFISYNMKHPLHEWKGVSNNVTSVILYDKAQSKILNTAVSVKFASFDSKNANRDSHAMEVAEAILYPNITYSSTSIETKENILHVNGIITFHNIKKAISFVAEQSEDKSKVNVKGKLNLKLTDFNIEPPSLLGMSTNDNFEIYFNMVYYQSNK